MQFGPYELSKTVRGNMLRIKVPNSIKQARQGCGVESDRKNVLLPLFEGSCLRTLSLVIRPDLCLVVPRDEDDHELCAVGVNHAQMIIEVLASERYAFVLVVEDPQSYVAKLIGDTLHICSVLPSE